VNVPTPISLHRTLRRYHSWHPRSLGVQETSRIAIWVDPRHSRTDPLYSRMQFYRSQVAFHMSRSVGRIHERFHPLSALRTAFGPTDVAAAWGVPWTFRPSVDECQRLFDTRKESSTELQCDGQAVTRPIFNRLGRRKVTTAPGLGQSCRDLHPTNRPTVALSLCWKLANPPERAGLQCVTSLDALFVVAAFRPAP